MNERKLRELGPNTLAALNEVEGLIDMALDEARDQSETAEEALIFVEERLIEASHSAVQLPFKLEDVLELIQRLMAERRTAQDAFEAGWEGRYHDIVARLSGVEYDWLQRALGLAPDDHTSNDETPF